MKKAVRITLVTLVAGLVLLTAACPANDAVNKYLNTLTAVQKGEIVAHNDKEVDDTFHIQFQQYMKVGFTTGGDLDRCAAIQVQGNDSADCIDAAQEAFNNISAAVNSKSNPKLQALASVAGAALKNAITVIRGLKSQPPPAKPSPSSGFAFWLMGLGLLGLVVDVDAVANLLKLVADEEPVFFEWITNMIKGNKGKSAEELRAMNQTLIQQGIATADAEIANTKAKML